MAINSPGDIVNLSLQKLGEPQVVGLSDADTRGNKAAREARDAYEHVRDLVVEMYDWKCALHLVELPADEEAPKFGFSYMHTPPEDYLRFVGIYDGGVGVRYQTASEKPWDVGTNAAGELRLLTNDNPALMFMVRRVENVASMPATLVEAIACRLALHSSPQSSASKATKDRIERDYGFAIRDAKRTNAIQQSGQAFVTSGWTDAAYGLGPSLPPRIGPIVGA